ncbi:MAG: biotin/lipoyl-binding protein, partial [Nannocystaceae bacterium]
MIARRLVGAVLAFIVALFVVPWQQSVSGGGRLIAYAPLERQQTIEAPISGRLESWYVQEGDHVEAGELIAEIKDNDPSIIERLERERDAAQAQIDAAVLAIATNEARIVSLQGVQDSSIVGVELRRQMSLDRVDAAEQALDAAKASYTTAKLNLERRRTLHEKGLASTRELELATLEEETTRAGIERSEASLRAAKREAKAFAADRGKTTS